MVSLNVWFILSVVVALVVDLIDGSPDTLLVVISMWRGMKI